eukprot:437122_1
MYVSYLWLICWFFVPITIYSKKYYHSLLLYHSAKYSSLTETKQTKVSVKLIASVYYLCMFIVGAIDLYPYNDVINGTYRKLTNFEDIVGRIGMVLVVSFYLTEIFYCHKEMSWLLILHHMSSSMICFCVFEEFSDIEPYISRFFVFVFGFLLSIQWLLYAASVYYHLSSAKNIKRRLCFYILGILTHIAFTVSQMYCGIKFKINNPDTNEQRKRVSLIIFIIFEICITPTQLRSFYDFYVIIAKKILINNTMEIKTCDVMEINGGNIQIHVDLNIACPYIEYAKSNSYSQNLKMVQKTIEPMPLKESRFVRSCPVLSVVVVR